MTTSSAKAKLASPGWQTGLDDTLANADVYNLVNPGVINSLPDLLQGIDSGIANALLGAKSLADKINTVKSNIAKAESTAKAALNSADRINLATGITTNILKSAGLQNADMLVNQAMSTANMAVKIGGVVKEVRSTDFSNASSLNSLIGKYTQDNNLFKVSDLGAQASVCAGLVNSCSTIGIRGTFTDLSKQLVNTDAVKQAAAACFPSVVGACDAVTLKQISDAYGIGGFAKLHPDCIEQFCSKFDTDNAAVEVGQQSDVENYSEVMAACDSMNPGWSTTVRASETSTEHCYDMSKIITYSSDMKTVMKSGALASDSDKDQLATLSAMYNPTSVVNELNTLYPYTQVSTNQVTV